MNKDRVQGRIKQAKGKTKRAVGKLLGDARLERKGMIETAAGSIQAVYGGLKEGLQKPE